MLYVKKAAIDLISLPLRLLIITKPWPISTGYIPTQHGHTFTTIDRYTIADMLLHATFITTTPSDHIMTSTDLCDFSDEIL
jgi:hypothetical protein